MPYDQVMHKWKAGSLKSGGSGKTVKSQKQAVAIMLSEKRSAESGKSEYASTHEARKSGKKASYSEAYDSRH